MTHEVGKLPFLRGGGETGELIRSLDWSATPLGPPETWPSQLRTIVGIMLGSNQPMFVAWGPQRLLLYNDCYAEILARKHPGAMGRPFFEAWSELVDSVGPIMDRAYAGESIFMDNIRLIMHRRGFREETSFNFSYTPVCDESGRTLGVFCPCTETTGQVRAMRELHENEAELAAIFAQAAVGISQLTLEGGFQRVNDELCRLLGRPREQLLQIGVPDVTHPDDLPHSFDALKRLIETGEPTSLDKRYVRPDGSVIWANSALTRLDDEQGRPRAVLAVTVNLTERREQEMALRRSEQHLRELSRSLEQRVAERTAELQAQTARLRHLAAELASAEHRERKRLAALLHDDLQQLLVAIRMQIGRAHDARSEKTADALSRATRLIDEAVARSRDLTHELRPPVLYEAGLVPALEWLRTEMAKRHDLEVTFDAIDPEPILNDDIKALLFDSVRELLFNVAKHAGVRRAEVVLREERARLCISVRDAGRGFEPHAASSDHRARGFGLFSIRERLAALGGDMIIDAAPDRGTYVELQLAVDGVEAEVFPVTHDELAKTGSPASSQPVDQSRDNAQIRVLVVDDHAIVRQGIANMLDMDERLTVVGEAADGLAAIEAVERHRPDVVLVDVNMPRMNGVEATREIHRRWPSIVAVGLSVQSDDATAQSMRDAGASAFLPKASDSDQMITTIVDLARSASHPD